MYSNSERLRLAQIEAELRADDPEFVERFLYTGSRGFRRTRHGMTAGTWWVIVAVALFASWALDSAVLLVIALMSISIAMCMWSFQADLRNGQPSENGDPSRGG